MRKNDYRCPRCRRSYIENSIRFCRQFTSDVELDKIGDRPANFEHMGFILNKEALVIAKIFNYRCPGFKFKQKMKCYYKKQCLDGSRAAAVIKRKYSDCEFIGTLPFDCPRAFNNILFGEKIFILDACLSIPEILNINALAGPENVIIYDPYDRLNKIHRALCEVVWMSLFPSESMLQYFPVLT
jgi:hypothetical protein